MTTPGAAIRAFVMLLVIARCASAQGGSEPFAITDNSFFVEEAFTQDRGFVQNTFVWQRVRGGGWDANFTQEWPVISPRHQLAYTIPFDGGVLDTHLGGVLLTYRFQALTGGAARPRISPRVSLILPTGRPEDVGDRVGLQLNLSFSKQFGDFYVHTSAGLTRLHRVPLDSGTTSLTSPSAGGSVIWRLTQLLNLMLETGVEFTESAAATRVVRDTDVLVSPGFRAGWNISEQQLVVGVAVPVNRTSGRSSVGLLSYLSYELPFTKNH